MRHGLAAAISLFIALALVPTAGAQAFGKNKVQYEALEWEVLETPHLRLHYHTDAESLARHLAVYAESVCVEFDGRFRLPPQRKIPFLLYAVHHLFQQTNATPSFISEGTGGLTELIKGRVLLPHTGSWARLRWVTRHELAHAYMLEKLARVMRENKRTQNYLPPLWFIEGLAEYMGTTWDADAEGLLRDAVLSGRAMPLTQSEEITGTVLMYKEGQSFLLWLVERFGEARLIDVMDGWHKAEDFETAFRLAFDETIDRLDEEWFESLRRRYYPVVATANSPGEIGKRLSGRGYYHLGPRVLPAKGHPDSLVSFCYFSASESGVDLMLSTVNAKGKRRESRLLRGGTTTQFESFHLFENRPDVSPSGTIVLSSKQGGRDALMLVDPDRGRVFMRFNFPHLVAIHDPALAPDDRSIIFAGQDYGGRTDLYRVTWHEKKARLERLTNDDFDDVEPNISPDGKWVVFASDRGDYGGRYSLFRLALTIEPMPPGPVAADDLPVVVDDLPIAVEDLPVAAPAPAVFALAATPGTLAADAPPHSPRPEAISEPPSGSDRQPVYSPDGKWIAFRSTRGGTSDLWVRPADPSHEARRVTRLLGPATDPDWLNDGAGLVYTAQHEVTFRTHEVRFNPDTLVAEPEPVAERIPVLPVSAFSNPPSRYERRLAFDLVQSAIGYDPTGGGAEPAGQVALSDVLGNEQIFIYVGNDADRYGNFWDGFQGSLTYVNRARRLNWGVGLFRLTETYDSELDMVRREPRVGIQGLISYPVSKFTRVEASLVVRHSKNHFYQSGQFGSADLVSNYASVIHDNTRWTWMGPSGGQRLYLSGGFTRDLAGSDGNYTTFRAEARQYMMPVPHLVSVTRVQGQASGGNDAQRFYMGGSFALRGYDRRSFAGYQTLLVQQELRMPLLRRLQLAVPGLWTLPYVGGAAFADAAWLMNGPTQTRVGSTGFGVYLLGGYYPAIRWNWVWLTPDFQRFSSRPVMQFSIAFNF